MSVTLAGGCPDRVPRSQVDDLASLHLDPAQAGDDDEDLAARVRVPGGAGAVLQVHRHRGQVRLLTRDVEEGHPGVAQDPAGGTGLAARVRRLASVTRLVRRLSG